jgi:hypothetical protein
MIDVKPGVLFEERYRQLSDNTILVDCWMIKIVVAVDVESNIVLSLDIAANIEYDSVAALDYRFTSGALRIIQGA